MARTTQIARRIQRRSGNAQATATAPILQKLEDFRRAIRSKQGWVTKILDEERGLGLKWAVEAGFLTEEDLQKGGGESNVVLATIRDLKSDARRISILDHSLRFESTHLAPRAYPSQEIDADVQNALKYASLARLFIRPPPLKEEVGAYVSDGLVPVSLHQELVKELDALAALGPKDFHPGTNQTVQNLIHPSLYSYVANVTPINDPSKLPRLEDGKFETTMHHSRRVETFESQYAWIPSVFRISEDGTDAHIESYINGLGPRERFPVLYRLIEKVFVLALPHLERSLDFKFSPRESSSVKRWRERWQEREGTTLEAWKKVLERQRQEKIQQEAEEKAESEKLEAEIAFERQHLSGLLDKDMPTSRFGGRSLKVIVKAANYVLNPGQEYGGTWHIEGQPHEQIAASLIYYYDTDDAIADSGLSLRRLKSYRDFPSEESGHQDAFIINFEEEEGPELDEYGWEVIRRDYPSDWEEGVLPSNLPNYVSLGIVPTNSPKVDSPHTGRMLSFPNWVQHRVVGVKNSAPASRTGPAKRKILCFFLVQEEEKPSTVYPHPIPQHFPGFAYEGIADLDVLTTSDIPYQERACNIPTLQFLLRVGCDRLIGKQLPQELVEYVLSFTELGITREQAEENRLGLMDDRKIKGVAINSRLWEESFSLCEH